MPRPACEPGIFCFSFIFSPEQFLRPFGYCATLRILSERFKPFFQSSHFLKQHLPISGRSPIFQELAPRERKRLIVQNRPQHQIWAFRWTGLGSKNNHGSHQCLLNFSNIFQNWQFDRRLSCNLNPFTIATLPNSPTTNTLIVFYEEVKKCARPMTRSSFVQHNPFLISAQVLEIRSLTTINHETRVSRVQR